MSIPPTLAHYLFRRLLPLSFVKTYSHDDGDGDDDDDDDDA